MAIGAGVGVGVGAARTVGLGFAGPFEAVQTVEGLYDFVAFLGKGEFCKLAYLFVIVNDQYPG